MKNMKSTLKIQLEDPVWCDGCRIRIAPYDQHVVVGQKLYHRGCYSRYEKAKTISAATAASNPDANAR
jgi:hypothetical protein